MPCRPDCDAGILTVGLNATWQRILEFDGVDMGTVNRATACSECFAGKAQNVLRALACGGRTDAVVAQLAGGATGRRCVDDLEASGIRHETVWTEAETRVCTTVMETGTGRTTELIAPSPRVAGGPVDQLRRRLETEPCLECLGTALCGTWPPGADVSAYLTAAARGRKRGFVVLDAWREVTPVLEQGVDILKVNESELCELAGEADLGSAARACLRRYSVPCIAVTAGARAAHLFAPNVEYTYEIAPLETVVNPIGAGDCVTAGMLAHLVPGNRAERARCTAASPLRPTVADIAEAFRQALAWGRASCLQRTPSLFRIDDAQLGAIRMQRRRM